MHRVLCLCRPVVSPDSIYIHLPSLDVDGAADDVYGITGDFYIRRSGFISELHGSGTVPRDGARLTPWTGDGVAV